LAKNRVMFKEVESF